MDKIFRRYLWVLLVLYGIFGSSATVFATERFKVLVVFSYEKNAPWDIEIREEIEKILNPVADVSFFYLDTKIALAGGEKKARAAYAYYQQLQPDGVIAVDDNAQSMFVVPYLKDKVTIPIMFCGVNGTPENYGYPTKNISGVLERFHLEESISFSRQLTGQIETFAFMVKQSPVADLIYAQLEAEKNQLSARMVAFLTPSTMAEALAMIGKVKDSADLLFLVALRGLDDNNGGKLVGSVVIPQLTQQFGKPTTSIAESVVNGGALCAVITNGREHGRRVAGMLLKALQGTPVHQLPMIKNQNGIRIINVSTLSQLKLKPSAQVLRGAKLVISE